MMNPRTTELPRKIYYVWITLLILVGVFLRFYNLDERAVHHDESLHGTYARYAVENPEQGFYHYNPMLHGPLLYNCIAWIFSLFGISTFALRSLNALLGSLFILTPLLFKRFLSPGAVVWSTATIALSPSLIYWSRFAHHDYLVLASYVLLASGIFLCSARVGIVLCLLSFALQYTIKANVFVFAALILGYLVFDLLCIKYSKMRDGAKSLLSLIWRDILLNKGATLLGSIIATIVFSALYSGNFRDSTGILDGLYRKVFAYWIEQHQIQRLDGPFSFHLLVLSLYELPLLLAFISALYLSFLRLPTRGKKCIAILSLACVTIPFVLPGSLYNNGFLEDHIKVKSPFDLFVSLQIAILAVALPINFLKNNQRALSFFCYLSLSTLWTYSFLGEKVPWLTIYPQVSALIFTILFFDKNRIFSGGLFSIEDSYSLTRLLLFTSITLLLVTTLCIIEGLGFSDPGAISIGTLRIIGWSIGGILILVTLENLQIDKKIPALALVFFMIVSLYTSILTNFTRAGDKKELLSQVHTSLESHQLFLALRDYLTDPLKQDERSVLISGASVWPATWYLRNVTGYHFTADKRDYSTFNYLIVDEADEGVDESFNTQDIPLQSWWVPDYSKVRIKTLLTYYFTHEPWSLPGSLQVKLAIPIVENGDENQADVDESGSDNSEEEETEELDLEPLQQH